MQQVFIELFGAWAQGLVLCYGIGLPPLLKSADKRRGLLLTGLLTACFVTLASVGAALLRPLIPHTAWKYCLPLCSAALCGLLDLLCLTVLALAGKLRLRRVIPYLHLSACAGTVLGALLLGAQTVLSPIAALRFGLRCGGGYLLASLMLAAALPTLTDEKMPAAVRGWRGVLLYTGVLALAAACLTAR